MLGGAPWTKSGRGAAGHQKYSVSVNHNVQDMGRIIALCAAPRAVTSQGGRRCSLTSLKHLRDSEGANPQRAKARGDQFEHLSPDRIKRNTRPAAPRSSLLTYGGFTSSFSERAKVLRRRSPAHGWPGALLDGVNSQKPTRPHGL